MQLSNRTCLMTGRVVCLLPLAGTFALALLILLGLSSTAHAVDCGNANDEASLNSAIACANAAGAGTHTIMLIDNISLTASTTVLDNSIGDAIIIEGGGFAVDGQDITGVRVFEIEEGTTVLMNAMTVTGGNVPQDVGGGILNSGILTITNSTIEGNLAGIAGGGLANRDTLTVVASTISNNSVSGGQSPGEGGGIQSDFALATIINTTISGNSADWGGGLYSSNSEVELYNSTVTNNSSSTLLSPPTGGGINSTGEGVVTLYNTIVANQAAGEDCDFFANQFFSTLVSAGNNLDSDGTCLNADSTIQASDITSGTAHLGPLQVNTPGATATHALLAGSDAIDNGSDSICVNPATVRSVDQRGVTRPQGPTCDIGAYEANTGTITIVKIAAPKDGTNFAFTGDLGTFSLDDTFFFNDDNDGITNTKSFEGLIAASYTINEVAPTGWQLNTITCQSTDQANAPLITTSGVTIDLSINETVTCTFNNLQDGQLVIVKEASVKTSQVFTFTEATLGTFTLIDDGTGASNAITFTVPGNTGYSVSEVLPTGWQQSGEAFCSNEGSADDVFVSAGDTVVCTFFNVADPATLTIMKDATPADGTDVTFRLDSSLTTLSFSLDDAVPDDGDAMTSTHTISNLLPGSYTITETVPAGWTLDNVSCTDAAAPISNGVSIALRAGAQVTCTFSNARPGTIILQKQTIPAGAAGSFALSGDVSGSLRHGEQLVVNDVAPGQYIVTESDATPAFFLSDLACDEDSSTSPSNVDLGTRTATINIEPGETVTCIFTNTQTGRLVLQKQTVPAAVSDSFTFSGDVTGSMSDAGQLVANNLRPGPYVVTENNAAPNFFLTNLVCDDGASATPSSVNIGTRTVTANIDPGETVTCIFTNTQRGLISVTKTTNVPAAAVGSTVIYTYRVTNSGGVELTNVTAGDDKLGPVSLNTTTLASGAVAVGTLSYTIQEGDLPGPLVNTVAVTGTPPAGPVVTASANAAVTLTSAPILRIRKTANVATTTVGDTINYTYRVTNTGDVTLSSLVAVDDQLGSVTLGQTTLAPGQNTVGFLSYVVVTSDLPGPLVNTVVVTGTPPVGNPVTNSAGAAVAIFDLPSLRVHVTGDPTSLVAPGGPVDYTVVVTNTSVSELTLTALNRRFGTAAATGVWPFQDACTVPQTMPVGGTYTCIYREQVTGQAGTQIEFIVTGIGRNAAGREATASDNEFTPILAAPTALEGVDEPFLQSEVLLPLVLR